ncbi:MAG TPA: aspartate--tRNA(Asn) ligase, partial [archaeon]|nr:aspartate--tRNA(Asn) ligase [archaeon]
MAIDLRNRTYSAQALALEEESNAVVAGWVKNSRVKGGIAFIVLRDRKGSIQLTVKDGKSLATAKGLTPESVIAAKGKIVQGKQKSGEKELLVEELELLSLCATPLPIDMTGAVPSALDKRLDHRFLDLRTQENQAIFSVRSKLNEFIRDHLISRGFVEMQTPKIAGQGVEGGSTVFKFNYFGKEAFLSQSQQLYKQMMMAAGFDKVFEIGPSFRAEKSFTRRHLAEFTQLDFEMAFIDSEEDVMKALEELLHSVLKRLKEEAGEELKVLKKEVVAPKLPFPRMEYLDCVKLLEKHKVKVPGNDIGTEQEHRLCDITRKEYGHDFLFITKFPWEFRPFYAMKDNENSELSKGFD